MRAGLLVSLVTVTLAAACGPDESFEREPGQAYEFRMSFEDGELVAFEPIFDEPDLLPSTQQSALNPSIPSGQVVLNLQQNGIDGDPPPGAVELVTPSAPTAINTTCLSGGGAVGRRALVDLNVGAGITVTSPQVQVISASDPGFRLCNQQTRQGTPQQGDWGAIAYPTTVGGDGNTLVWLIRSNTGTFSFVGRVVGGVTNN